MHQFASWKPDVEAQYCLFGIENNLLPKTELLNETIFYDLGHARDILARWSMGYNQKPPHSALGYLTPAAFARTFTATLDRLRSYADRPLLRRRHAPISAPDSGSKSMNVGGHSRTQELPSPLRTIGRCGFIASGSICC